MSWWEMWSAASVQPAEQRKDKETWLKDLHFALHALQQTPRESQDASASFAAPLSRLDELAAQAGEFPLFVRVRGALGNAGQPRTTARCRPHRPRQGGLRPR